jgi:hypothetical protein
VSVATARKPRLGGEAGSWERVEREEARPEFKRFVLFGGEKVYFKHDVLEETEIAVRVSESDIFEFIKSVGAGSKIRQTSSGLWIFDETLYKQLVVYASALGFMKEKTSLRVLKLIDAVRLLDEYSLHFWYTEIVGKYRRKGLQAVARVAKAFRVLYGIDE